MPGKQTDQPTWASRHAWIVGLIGVLSIALAVGAASAAVPGVWLIVPALSLAGPAFVSALPARGPTAVAGVSAAALVTQTVFAVAVFGASVHANLVMVAALCVIALYERWIVLTASFLALAVAAAAFLVVDPALVGLRPGEDHLTAVLAAAAATGITAIALFLLTRDQRRSRHIAAQQRAATDAYLQVAGTLMLVLDREGVVTVANRQTCLTLDLEESQIVGREWFELALTDEYRDDARRLFRASFERFREFGELIRSPQEYENVIYTRDRTRRTVQWWATFVTDMAGNPTGMVCSGTDVTDARAASAALERSRLELDALRRLAQKVASLDDSRQAVVDAAMALTGATLVTLMEPDRTQTHLHTTVASNPSLLTNTIDLAVDGAISVSARAFATGQPQFMADVSAEAGANQTIAASMGLVSAIVQPITGAGGILGVLAVGWDHHVDSLGERKAELVGLVSHEAAVSLRRRESLAQLERAALIDPLTGVANRRAFDAELPLALRRAAEGTYPLALVMIDLNEFKAVNDVLGHEAGDHVLINTSGAWSDALRAGDLLARLGGDEFAVLLPTCDEREMHVIVDRLRRVTPHGPGASIGGAMWDGVETASSLIRRADRSQYADKDVLRRAAEDRAAHHSAPVHPRPRIADPRGDVGPGAVG